MELIFKKKELELSKEKITASKCKYKQLGTYLRLSDNVNNGYLYFNSNNLNTVCNAI